MKFYFKILYQIDNTFYLFAFWCKNLKNPYFTILQAICLWNSGPKPANFPDCLYVKQNFAQIFGITSFVFFSGAVYIQSFLFFQVTADHCEMPDVSSEGECHTEPDLPGGWFPARKPRPANSTAEGLWTQWVELWLLLLYFLPKYWQRVEIKKQPPPGSSQIDLSNTASSHSERYM